MTPFDSYTFAKAQARVARAITPPRPSARLDYATNRRLYDGDHWGPGGCDWLGPRPQPGEPDAQAALREIERAFISKNAIEEVVSRHVGGVIGQEPQWKLTVRRALGTVTESQDDGTTREVDEQPTEIEQALIEEAEAALTSWWDARGLHHVLKEATVALLLARRGLLRLFVPRGLLQTTDSRTGAPIPPQLPKETLTASLNWIYLHAPDPTQAALTTHTATQRQAGIYLYADEDEDTNESTEAVERAELVYLDEQGRTVIRILGGEAEDATEPLDLTGHLTIYEMKRDVLITPQVRQLQGLLNVALTMLGHNVVLAGFLERTLLNAQMPGQYVGEGTARRFVADPVFVGGGTINSFVGATYTDEQGITHMANPSLVYRDPVAIETFRGTREEAYRCILEETDQLHALISGDATASGESRKQARADFKTSLLDTQAELNQAGRWLLETVLAMGAAFSGRPGRFAELRAVFECRLDTGPISSDDQREVRENVKAGLRSEETGMVETGVQDVDAERARIAAERDERMARSAKLIQAQPQQPTEVGAVTMNGNGQGETVPA